MAKSLKLNAAGWADTGDKRKTLGEFFEHVVKIRQQHRFYVAGPLASGENLNTWIEGDEITFHVQNNPKEPCVVAILKRYVEGPHTQAPDSIGHFLLESFRVVRNI